MDIYEKLLNEKSLDELLEEARIWESVESKKGYEEKRIGSRVRIWPKKIEEVREFYLREKRENEL